MYKVRVYNENSETSFLKEVCLDVVDAYEIALSTSNSEIWFSNDEEEELIFTARTDCF